MTMHDPDGLDPQIRVALAEALGERKVRLNDRRLIVIFLFLVGLLFVMGIILSRLATVVEQSNTDRKHFEMLITASCVDSRANARTINLFLDQQITAYETSPVLTPRQRKERAAMFVDLKQRIPPCPPRK